MTEIDIVIPQPTDWKAMFAALEQATREAERRLSAALLTYGRHTLMCERVFTMTRYCTCGLDSALRLNASIQSSRDRLTYELSIQN